MTREEIFKLAREAGATPYTNRHYPERPTHTFTVEQLERFAALVADAEAKRIHDEGMVTVGHMREQIAAEREACAQHLDAQNTAITDKLAAEIRARGQS